RRRVHLFRLAIFAEVVVGDREVERGLGVARVDLERLLEVLLGLREAPLAVRDHAEHVEEVGEAAVLARHLMEIRLRLVVLALLVVLLAERHQVAKLLIHAGLLWLRSVSRCTPGTASPCSRDSPSGATR